MVERVRSQLEAQASPERVPLGAPARSAPDLSALSPQEKILLGKMRRYYSECVLREQAWVMDDSTNVQQALEAELGSDCTIEAFVRFEIGD